MIDGYFVTIRRRLPDDTPTPTDAGLEGRGIRGQVEDKGRVPQMKG